MVLSAYVGHREASELNRNCFITSFKVLKYILSSWCEFVLHPFCIPPCGAIPFLSDSFKRILQPRRKRNWSAAWFKLNGDKRWICRARINNPLWITGTGFVRSSTSKQNRQLRERLFNRCIHNSTISVEAHFVQVWGVAAPHNPRQHVVVGSFFFFLSTCPSPSFVCSVSLISLTGDRPCGVLRRGVFCPPLVGRLPQ